MVVSSKLVINFNEIIMSLINKSKLFFLLFLVSGCSALDIKPWSAEDILDGIFTSVITGNETSYGNEAQCNHLKATCGSGYRVWVQNDGKLACSCSN